MTQATSEAYVEVDPYDPEDASAVEVAIGIAIAEALAHPPDARAMTAAKAETIMEAAVGVTLRFYAQRVLQLMTTQWSSARDALPTGRPVPVDQALAPIDAVVTAAVRQAIDETGESVRDLIDAASKRIRDAKSAVEAEYADTRDGRAELARADVVERGYNDLESLALDRLRTGMSSISRVLTTRTREAAKAKYAESVGAVGCVWRTRRDTKVRNSHGDLEGDFVALGGTFHTVTGAEIRRPGDPRAPLHETIGCRCRLSYRMPAQ